MSCLEVRRGGALFGADHLGLGISSPALGSTEAHMESSAKAKGAGARNEQRTADVKHFGGPDPSGPVLQVAASDVGDKALHTSGSGNH